MSPRLRICTICGALSPDARCPEHSARQRPTPPDPFYSTNAWRKAAAKAKARDEHRCVCCGQAGTHTNPLTVHHHHERRTHPEQALDLDNLVTLLRSCHARIEAARRARAKR